MPLISPEQAAEARRRLKEALSKPLGMYDGKKTVMTDAEFRARFAREDSKDD